MTRNEQLEELRYAMRQTKDKRLFERYQSVLLHLQGKNNIEIASIIQRNRATVGEYIKTYKKEDITGLRMGISTGKPNRLTVEQRAKLADSVINNVFFPSTSQIKLAVPQFINCQNKNKQRIIDRLCVRF